MSVEPVKAYVHPHGLVFANSNLECHQRGDAAPTTAEARGTTRPTAGGAVSVNAGGEMSGRAAGAQLTGQRQDGQSQVPVREQYPCGSHGAAGFNFPPRDSDALNYDRDRDDWLCPTVWDEDAPQGSRRPRPQMHRDDHKEAGDA